MQKAPAEWPQTWPGELGSIAIVVPHPDDEVFAAALMLRAKRAGARVALVCATRGDRGTLHGRPAPPLEVAAHRTKELEASAANLGVDELILLDLPDGGLDASAHADVVNQSLDGLGCDAVVSYGHDGGYGHRDHVALAEIVAARDGRWFPLAFHEGLWKPFRQRMIAHAPDLIAPTAAPTTPVWQLTLDDREREAKRRSFMAHESQLTRSGTFLFAALERDILARELYGDSQRDLSQRGLG